MRQPRWPKASRWRRATARAKTSLAVAVAADLHPQTRAVLQTRATPLGWQLVDFAPGDAAAIAACRPFAVVLQYPGTTGAIRDLRAEIRRGPCGWRAGYRRR